MLETDETSEGRSHREPSGARLGGWRLALDGDAARGLGVLIPHEHPSLPADPVAAERIFARRLKRERLRRGWRQEDLAAELANLGLELHPSAIAKIEREPDPGKKIEPRMIRLNEAVIVAKVFGLSLEEMLSDRDVADPVRELERLRDRLAHAHAEARATHTAAQNAQHKVMDLEVQARDAELRASLFTKLNVRDGEDIRAVAEQFLDSWLGCKRSDLIANGWGKDDRGEPRSPDGVLRFIEPIGQLWPDLKGTCAAVTAKIETDAKWWINEGRRLHEEWRREQMQFSVNDRVEHHHHGMGRVSEILGSGDDITVIVDFESNSVYSRRTAFRAENLRTLRKIDSQLHPGSP